MEIKRISYTGNTTDEIYTWLDHLVEEVILKNLNVEAWNYIDLKVSKYMENIQHPVE